MNHAYDMKRCYIFEENKFDDDETVDYFPKIKLDSGIHGTHYLFSMWHQLVFFEAIGLGPLKSLHSDGNPPFVLTEAARFCLKVKKRNMEDDTMFMTIKKQTTAEFKAYVSKHDKGNNYYIL